MKKAVFLLKTDTGKMEAVCSQLSSFEAFTVVCMTYGRFDVIAIGNFKDYRDIVRFLKSGQIRVDGVRSVHTLVEAK